VEQRGEVQLRVPWPPVLAHTDQEADLEGQTAGASLGKRPHLQPWGLHPWRSSLGVEWGDVGNIRRPPSHKLLAPATPANLSSRHALRIGL
jgi:hypothetical protein